jgi:hypothetical protein
MNMFKLMIALLVGAVAALVPATAQAQQQYEVTPVAILTNLAPSTTNTLTVYTNVVSLTKWDNVAVSLSAASTNAGATTVSAIYSTSVDGSYWTTAGTLMAAPATSTSFVTTVSNVAFNAIGYLRFESVNVGTNGANVRLVVARKPKGRG